LRAQARVADKYVRRERPYEVVECVTETAAGTPVVRRRATLMI